MTVLRSHLLLIVLGLTLLCLTANGSAQQTTRYGQWQAGNDSQHMLEELRELVDEAERARAADRRFLRDLRDLIRQYDRPQSERVLFDNFSDGDFTQDPVWQVSEGTFRVDRGAGLRTLVAPQSEQPQSSKDPGQDLALAILGSLLKKNTANTGGNRQLTESTAGIHTLVPLSNAFRVELDLVSMRKSGLIDFAVVQEKGAGYRLIYRPDQSPSLELQRFSKRGRSTLATYSEVLNIEDDRPHQLLWSRDDEGLMHVSIDGRELIQVADLRIRQPFAAFQIRHRGGDFAMPAIAIWGTPRS